MDDETDTEILALQSMTEGGFLAPVAIALALIDAGVINKGRLLDIIESLHTVLAADYFGRLGDIEDAQLGLRDLRAWLDDFEWSAGGVVERLQTLEAASFREMMRMKNDAERRQKPPAGGDDRT